MNKDDLRQYIYDRMMGTLNLEECKEKVSFEIKNEMSEGEEIAKIAKAMYEMRMEMDTILSDKLSKEEYAKLNVEMLGEYFYEFAEKVAFKMFDYGYLAGAFNNSSKKCPD